VAVAHENGLLDADDGAELGEVVGEVADAVALGRSVAVAAAAWIDRRDRVRPGKVVELRLERGVVSAPAGDEEQLGPTAPGSHVVDSEILELGTRHGADPLTTRCLCGLFRHPTR